MSNVGWPRSALSFCLVLLGCCDLAGHAAAAPASAAAHAPAPPAPVVSAPPAGDYRVDKAHASLVLRVSHMGFSTYTTRFGRFDANLHFDPAHIAASTVVATIDADSFQTDGWPQQCIDIVKGAQMLDVAHHPQIV